MKRCNAPRRVSAREIRSLAGCTSVGEQQMTAIGRAVMAGPRIILLDEPSHAGL
jgi:ABC-type branched-subunit amino acid transport system ATPase component